MSIRKYLGMMISVITLCLVILCGCEPQPAYYTPYGEGVDPSTVTTGVYERKPAPSTTGLLIVTKETTATTTSPTRIAVLTDGYVLCPNCHGIMTYCEYCNGSTYRKGEMYDPDSGAFRRYKIKCDVCVDDPGFTYCDVCKNQLVIPTE